MSKLFLSVLVIYLLLSCKNEAPIGLTKDTKTIAITLTKHPENSPFGISLRPMNIARSPKPQIKGVPKMDTFLLVYTTMVKSRSVKEWYAKGLIDSIVKPKDSFHWRNYAISGYGNGKQLLIFDSDNDLDFSDEKVMEFDKQLSKTVEGNVRKVKKSFPLLSIHHDFYNGREVVKRKKYVRPMPYANYSTGLKDSLRNNLQLVTEISSYNSGEIEINNILYKVLISDGGLFGPSIIIKKDGEAIPKTNDADYLDYSLKDTMLLEEKYYRLDSINPSYNELVIKDLELNVKDYGYRKGEKLNDFQISGIDKQAPYEFSQLLKDKDYVVIDFWGTWCAPCKELTPDLLNLNNKYGNNINLLSVAFDKEINPVIDYINVHEMKWKHHFIQGDAKSRENRPALIQGLKIETFPTFMLIDSDFRIVYRGVGKTGLTEIEEKLKNLK